MDETKDESRPRIKWFDIGAYLLDFADTPPTTPTGIAPLDAALGGGMRPGLHVLAAPPASGKTSLGLDVVANVLERAEPAGVISLELGAAENVLRIASRMTGGFAWSDANAWAAELRRTGNAAGNPAWRAIEWLHQNHGDRLMITGPSMDGDPGARTVGEVSAHIEAASQAGARLVLLDYLQLVDLDAGVRREHESERVQLVVDELTRKATACGVALLALSAQSREGQKSQGMTSGSGSSRIEYAAQTVLTLRVDEDAAINPETGECGYLLEVRKNRYGPRAEGDDAIRLRCIPSTGRWLVDKRDPHQVAV